LPETAVKVPTVDIYPDQFSDSYEIGFDEPDEFEPVLEFVFEPPVELPVVFDPPEVFEPPLPEDEGVKPLTPLPGDGALAGAVVTGAEDLIVFGGFVATGGAGDAAGVVGGEATVLGFTTATVDGLVLTFRCVLGFSLLWTSLVVSLA
jgi:hypothetical protein